MTKTEILEMLDSTITSNGRGEISGKVLNLALRAIVNYIDERAIEVPKDEVVPDTPTDTPVEDVPTVEPTPELVSLAGEWEQRWGIGANETMGPDNWGSNTVISVPEGSEGNENYDINPVFGSLGFAEGGKLSLHDAEKNIWVMSPGTHNLLGPTNNPVYFRINKARTKIYAYADEACTDTKILLNDWAWVTDYVLSVPIPEEETEEEF